MTEIQTESGNLELEIRLLLEAVYLKYGYDFRNYAGTHIRRRLERRLVLDGLASISEMQHRVIHDRDFFDRLLTDLSVNVTEMFRDPWFYATVRRELVPRLRTYPFLKVWHAVCSAGQEVYSMCILLEEEGLR